MKKKLAILFGLVLLAFLGLSLRLIYINKENGENYKRQVLSQQKYESKKLPYKRGDILDANGTKLAVSEKVYSVIVDCKDMLETEEDAIEPTLKALSQSFPGIDTNKIRTYVKEHPSKRYFVASKQRKYDEIMKFEELKKGDENVKDEDGKVIKPNIRGIWFEPEYVRSYPNGSLASDVIGFTNIDKDTGKIAGNYGLEAFYNDILDGAAGREYGYLNEDANLERTIIPSKDGYNLVTTIDANIQSIVEQKLAEYNDTQKNSYRTGNGAKNVGCIIMDVNNGEIKAMANYPTYDLNNPYNVEALYGSTLLTYNEEKKRLEETDTVLNAENAQEALADHDVLTANLNNLWKNFCISNTYEPGSVAKPFTVAAGIESGRMTGGEYYTCNGQLHVGDHDIKCHNYKKGGDGTLSVQQSIEQSCNVALMLMGNQIGENIFLEYQQRFNFGLKTNIDLAAESRTASLVFNAKSMGPTELATSTFGQGYNVTMIQMIAGFCSLVNGGYYYEPHVVNKITTGDGTVVKNIEPRLLKQTISESTSELIRQYCNGVVINGTGKTARPAGYAIGGKTGTAEMVPRDKINYVVSFMGFAPSDNPQLAIYVVVDRPNTWIQDDAKHATRLVRSILTDVLPYMHIYPTEELSEAEAAELAQREEEMWGSEEATEDEEEAEDAPKETITDANGGDMTSSTPVAADDGDTAPLTGTLLNPETGLGVGAEDNSPE